MSWKRVPILLITLLMGQVATADAKGIHIVSAGDTLWKISRDYGCSVQNVRISNELKHSTLSIGQRLDVSKCEPSAKPKSAKPATLRYTVLKGDTLGAIATRFGTPIRDIRRRNEIKGSAIFPGELLELLPTKVISARRPHPSPVLGQSRGYTNHGSLRRPTQLKPDKGYFVRRKHRSFGAAHTVAYTTRVVSSIRSKFPKLHRLAIGDISAEQGGKISMHASHQSGRDIDIGFYFKRKPDGYPQSFIVGTAKNLHFGATWKMLKEFAALTNRPLGVEKIFLSYSTQRILYKIAKRRGVSTAELERMFQYPRGKYASLGILRHEPGHNEHIHVRFKCPPKDKGCK